MLRHADSAHASGAREAPGTIDESKMKNLQHKHLKPTENR